MPTPNYWTGFSLKYSHLRRRFLFVSLAAFGVVFAILMLMTTSIPIGGRIWFGLIALAMPAVFASWTGLCASIWFDPEDGKLRRDSPGLSRLPTWIVSIIRWYAAIFLLFFAVASVAIPMIWIASAFAL